MYRNLAKFSSIFVEFRLFKKQWIVAFLLFNISFWLHIDRNKKRQLATHNFTYPKIIIFYTMKLSTKKCPLKQVISEGFFYFPILCCSQTGDHLQQDLAKFGKRLARDVQVETSNYPSHFWLHARTPIEKSSNFSKQMLLCDN
jgi:hypothetical protein